MTPVRIAVALLLAACSCAPALAGSDDGKDGKSGGPARSSKAKSPSPETKAKTSSPEKEDVDTDRERYVGLAFSSRMPAGSAEAAASRDFQSSGGLPLSSIPLNTR